MTMVDSNNLKDKVQDISSPLDSEFLPEKPKDKEDEGVDVDVDMGVGAGAGAGMGAGNGQAMPMKKRHHLTICWLWITR